MRVRLLDLLCRAEPGVSRAEHHARILCGEIEVDGERVRDPRRLLPESARVLRRGAPRFVSRGGLKLDGILTAWQLEVQSLAFIDAGASTGGFTDCLLQRGARRVCAVETGANQLAYRLRADPRVTVLAPPNIMALSRERLAFDPDAAVADLSLRSLRGAARHLLELAAPGWLLALVKPQYEMGAADGQAWAPGGVLRSAADRLAVLRRLHADLEAEGVYVARVGPSPLRGRHGNVEFFFLLVSSAQQRLPAAEQQLAALAAADGEPG